MYCSDVVIVVIVFVWCDVWESDVCYYEDDGSRYDVFVVYRFICSYLRFQNVSRWC